MRNASIILGLLLAVVLSGCEPYPVLKNFKAITNFPAQGDTVRLEMDLSGNIHDGVVIPSVKQTPSGMFTFSFQVYNAHAKPRKLYYKIYYQNESYKYYETDSIFYNVPAQENFYGSWENTADTFHITPEIEAQGGYITVTDSFRIVGNPRDERRYYGAPPAILTSDAEEISKIRQEIMRSPEWATAVKKHAEENKETFEEQLYKDALWTAKFRRNQGDHNNRWKRNPRTGVYSFLLVVCTENDLKNIPEHIHNIHLKNPDSLYVSPYHYFLHGDGRKLQQTWAALSRVHLRTRAELNVQSGVFVDCINYPGKECRSTHFSGNCNNSDSLFRYAHFEQYFHSINLNFPLNNIPVAGDMSAPSYTRKVYAENSTKFSDDERIKMPVKITDAPCQSVWYDAAAKSLFLKIPGDTVNLRKENTGLNTRLGFTYGKVTAKIKFPGHINADNVWNGVTNAVWLKFQSEDEWNNRDVCTNRGYIPKHITVDEGGRAPIVSYSEIDIEIVKEARHWPEGQYWETPWRYQPEDAAANRQTMITCTNWDLACRDAKHFVQSNDRYFADCDTFELNRWGDYYKAVTLKTPYNHDDLFDRFMYYQIDWRPDQIIWRVGPDMEHLKVVGHMDYNVTKIPNNQMVLVVTQEFHDAKWWPTAPFDQNNIPFPAKDIVGQISEVIIE